MKKIALPAFLVLSLIFSLSSFPFLAQAQEKKEVLVVVGTISIDKEEFLQLITKGKEIDAPPMSFTRSEFEENFESFLNYKLKVIEAESMNLDDSEEFNMEFASIKESLVAPFLIKNSIEEGEVKKVYGRLQEIVRARHILFQFPPNASLQGTEVLGNLPRFGKGEPARVACLQRAQAKARVCRAPNLKNSDDACQRQPIKSC
jgi:peptidyl-prolyl cis-trans isomerase SurA